MDWNFLWLRMGFTIAFTIILCRKKIASGDIKLLAAMLFSSGLFPLLCIMFFTFMGTIFLRLISRTEVEKVPLCVFAAPAYLIVCAAFVL